MIDRSIEEAFPASTLARAAASVEQKLVIAISGPGGEYVYSLRISHDPVSEESRIISEALDLDESALYRSTPFGVTLYGEDVAPNSFPYNSKRSFIAAVDSKHLHPAVVWFKDFVQGIWILKIDPRRVVAASRLDSNFLARDGTNFVAWYRYVSDEDPAAAAAGLAALREVIPEEGRERPLQGASSRWPRFSRGSSVCSMRSRTAERSSAASSRTRERSSI